MSNANKTTGCLGHLGDEELHSLLGIMINHYKDSHSTTNRMDHVMVSVLTLHLGKRKIIFKSAVVREILVPMKGIEVDVLKEIARSMYIEMYDVFKRVLMLFTRVGKNMG